MTTTKIDSVIAALTLEQAKEYDAVQDKYLWVMDSIFDPINLRVTDARVNRVEDRLEELLALDNHKNRNAGVTDR